MTINGDESNLCFLSKWLNKMTHFLCWKRWKTWSLFCGRKSFYWKFHFSQHTSETQTGEHLIIDLSGCCITTNQSVEMMFMMRITDQLGDCHSFKPSEKT